MPTTKLLSVRLSQKEINVLQNQASELGMLTAPYIRLILRQYVIGAESLAIVVNKTPTKPAAAKEVAPWKKPKPKPDDDQLTQVISAWSG